MDRAIANEMLEMINSARKDGNVNFLALQKVLQKLVEQVITLSDKLQDAEKSLKMLNSKVDNLGKRTKAERFEKVPKSSVDVRPEKLFIATPDVRFKVKKT